jgi:hypothetical protein
MTSKEGTVIIVARNGIDLDVLSDSLGPMAMTCGTIGTSIARAVKEGHGKASYSLSKLKIVMDTQDAFEMIFDNFELTDPKTLKPLVTSLITKHLSRSK